MSTNYPYANVTGALVSTINQLRKAFPAQVSAETLQKWGYAPKNENYIINTIRFLGLIDDEGKKAASAAKIFVLGDDEFAKGLAKIVKANYRDLFEHHGEDSWTLDKDLLTTYFRTADETSSTVGGRQASTFQALAGLAGHGDIPKASSPRTTIKKPSETSRTKKRRGKTTKEDTRDAEPTAVGLTIRIELNLPATTDQKVYDSIFKSVRKNLIDG